jgi:acetyl esterase
MPVDPCFAALLADRRNELRPPPPHISLDAIREANRAFLAAAPGAVVHAVSDDRVEQASGRRTAVRIYRPSADPGLPVTMFCHGGGFVCGDLETHDSICRQLCAAGGFVVIAVDYARAPESPYPGPVDDCEDALRWIVANATRLAVDGERIALCGDSAGANLATAVALRARVSGPRVRHLALLYPAVDPRCEYPSMHELARGHLLARSGMQWLWQQYLAAGDADNPEAALLLAQVGGLPPTTVVTAEFDPLRDEGEALAAHLREAGVPVALRRYAGMVHGFAGMPQLTPVADEALQAVARDLGDSLCRLPG